MKVLFICSGNNVTGVSPIIKNQGASLASENVTLEYFTINGKGIIGYMGAISSLKKQIQANSYDIIHAHYSLCGFVASMAGAKPLIVSLMGSDVQSNWIYLSVIKIFIRKKWQATIVKSKEMHDILSISGVNVVPNGVDFSRFYPIDPKNALKKLNWDSKKKYILFAADPSRYEKNFELASKAIKSLNLKNTVLKYLDNVSNDDMFLFYNASDVVLLTSLWEGSPNVIKEAMACNSKIVCTNVGDVQNVIGSTDGCFITTFEPENVSENIKNALAFKGFTNGRNNVSHLESKKIAKILFGLYRSIIQNKK